MDDDDDEDEEGKTRKSDRSNVVKLKGGVCARNWLSPLVEGTSIKSKEEENGKKYGEGFLLDDSFPLIPLKGDV